MSTNIHLSTIVTHPTTLPRWLSSLNLKAPKSKPHNPPETTLSPDPDPNFNITMQVPKFDTGNIQEAWIWNENPRIIKTD
ncbi:hypothetical protein BofuT4_uP136800.1 [Botrytis cinerea T4]|uniref:Uncharacterized protein n=1 Tax=Botryotinia fuckeliana (strain T4) TaxID=999810 RepID=G2YPT7_BOTF4|nr:hypothetical protein BofuT4_uP136800.1 [Botrytis cinerea T4]